MKSRPYFSLIIFLILVFAACTPNSGNQDQGWQTYQNENLGVSFDLPETWVIQEENGVITIAVDQEALDNQISSGAGASITLATTKDFDGFSDPADILELFMDFIEYGRPELEKVGEPELITIQEQSASTVTYQGVVREQPGIFVATIISNEDQIALILTVDGSGAEEFQDTLERITQSISVYTPTR